MRVLVLLAGLVVASLSPSSLAAAPAGAVGETCNGLPATLVGTPGGTVTGTIGPDVIVSAGAAKVDALDGDDIICTTLSGPPMTNYGTPSVTVLGGPGGDLVDRRGDTDIQAIGRVDGGSGKDTVLGAPGYDRVDTADGEADVVNTFGGADYVSTARLGSPVAEPDRVDLGTGTDRAYFSAPFAPSLSLSGGDGTDDLILDLTSDGEWRVDARAGRLEKDSALALTLGGFESYNLGMPDTLDDPAGTVVFDGTAAAETVSSDARDLTVDLRAGDDMVRVTEMNRRVHVNAGPGRDLLTVFGDKAGRLSADLARARMTERSRYGVQRSVARRFEDLVVEGGTVNVVGNDKENNLSLWGCNGVTVHAGGGADLVSFHPVDPDDMFCGHSIPLFVYGEGGADVLHGGPFADRLIGGPGRDKAIGGKGQDICRAEVRKGCER